MARISVEQKALTDPRFSLLGKLAGHPPALQHDFGLSRLIRIWNECQERESYELPPEIVSVIIGHEDGASWVVQVGLGELSLDGLIRIRGTKGRVEWLAARRAEGRSGGKRGGRPPKLKKPHNLVRLTHRGSRTETPPAPTPDSSSPSGSQNPKEKHIAGFLLTPPPVPNGQESPWFEKWWAAYRSGIAPRPMRDKHKVQAEWKAVKAESQGERMVSKLERQLAYRSSMASSNQFCPPLPDPIRYLKRKLWREELQ